LGRARLKVQNNSNTASPAKHAANVTHVGIGGAYRGKPKGGARTRATVDKVTVAIAVVEPLSVTDDGETVHVARGGAPAQLHVTV
jgi:hypothetical protein